MESMLNVPKAFVTRDIIRGRKASKTFDGKELAARDVVSVEASPGKVVLREVVVLHSSILQRQASPGCHS